MGRWKNPSPNALEWEWTPQTQQLCTDRMQSAEKSFQRKECFEIINDQVQELLQQEFVIKVTTEEVVRRSQTEWYLPLQTVFTPERATNVRLLFDSSSRVKTVFPWMITLRKSHKSPDAAQEKQLDRSQEYDEKNWNPSSEKASLELRCGIPALLGNWRVYR